MNPEPANAPAVCCNGWILLMASVVTGRSLSPIGTRDLGFAPGPSVEVSGRSVSPHHDAGSGRPVSTEALDDSLLLWAAPILRRRRSACQDRRRPGRVEGLTS